MLDSEQERLGSEHERLNCEQMKLDKKRGWAVSREAGQRANEAG
jgi:hypothetical protein